MQHSDTPVQDRPVIAYVTCPDTDVAKRIAADLVEQRKAACVNIVPGLASVYRWQGRIETAQEHLLMIKTRHECIDAIRARLQQLHPDDVPELIAVDICAGAPDYLDWLVQQAR